MTGEPPAGLSPARSAAFGKLDIKDSSINGGINIAEMNCLLSLASNRTMDNYFSASFISLSH